MNKKILLIYNNYSTFVQTDYELLSAENEVIGYRFKPAKGLFKMAVQMLKQKIFLLFNIWKFDTVFIWFADYHSFLPVLFSKIAGKQSFVVIGGYDVANFPELKYGSLTSPLRKKLTLFSIRNASLCIPVVENLEKRVNEIAPKAKTKTIYTGYQFDANEKPVLENERGKVVLTVSITSDLKRFMVKGLDRFRELAENLPDFTFYLIGVTEEAELLFEPVPENMILLPPLTREELIDYYLKASFYAQFSRSEGLPNALCEAMLYGCIPLGLDVGGIPAAIENTGLVMSDWDVKTAIDFIQKNHNQLNREVFKNQIQQKFDLKFRKEKLLGLI